MRKHPILIFTLLPVTFVLGLAFGWLCPLHQTDEVPSHGPSVQQLRQRIYGTNYLHLKGVDPTAEARLAGVDKIDATSTITLSYVGGLMNVDNRLQLHGDGGLYSQIHGTNQLITTIDQTQCKAFFREVLTSGILNYSDAVVDLKKDMAWPSSVTDVTDAPTTEIQIHVPELKVDKSLSIYAPEIELKNYPDIIEFRLVTQIEQKMLGWVPNDYPPWK